MDDVKRADFISGYTKVLTNAWASGEFRERLEAQPHAVLSESGLDVPEASKIQILRSVEDSDQDLDYQVKLWDLGTETGIYQLYVPDEPQVDTSELSEGELEAVAGGDDVSICCCCTPCCTG